MSYRLDQGKGRCIYHIGVEDDGCHSLLDYPAISESAWILESIARSLNSIVLERQMIQGEIIEGDENNGDVNGDAHDNAENLLSLKLSDDRSNVIVVDEPSVFGRGTSSCLADYDRPNMNEDENAEKLYIISTNFIRKLTYLFLVRIGENHQRIFP